MLRLEHLVAALLCALVLPSCSGNDVVVADLVPEASSSQNPPPDAGTPCHSNQDCDASKFCSKPSCDADAGQCDWLPLTCNDEMPGPPSCGCDGVSYWTDCLRKQHGVAAATHDQCEVGVSCGAPDMPPCPGDAVCARLLVNGDCNAHPPGSCWVVPRVCPPAPPMDARWMPCDGMMQCLSTCDAISRQMPFRMAPGPICP